MSFDWLLDLLFPSFCLGCQSLGSYLCDRCSKSINFYDPQTCAYCELPNLHGLTHKRCEKAWGLDGMFILAHYDGLIKQIIHQVKYGGHYAILKDVVQLIVQKYSPKFPFDYLVPVPLSSKRFNERGFNQAEVLARRLNSQLRIVNYGNIGYSNLLERTRETRPQFDLKYQDRKQNVLDAFGLSPKLKNDSLRGYSFCLIDDVVTTGSTIFECTKVLKRKGADFVWAIAISRGG